MHRRKAAQISAVVRRAIDAGRWRPAADEMAAIYGLERALSIRIQSGQPALDDMQARLITDYAISVLSQARAAAGAGSFGLTVRDRRALKVATLSVVPVMDSQYGTEALAA